MQRPRRRDWADPGGGSSLLWLVLDDRKRRSKGRPVLPTAVYADVIAPFLHFDEPLPNQLYVFGGRNQQDGALDTVEMFDTWHGRWVSCPNMSVRRAGCAASVLPDRRLLVVGGYDEKGIVKGLLTSCEVFDPMHQSWSGEVSPLKHARWGHGCATLRGAVYAVGGCSLKAGAPPREAFMETLRSCEVYEPATGRWLPSADLRMARAGSRIVTVSDSCMAAVGGCDDVFGRAEMLPTVEIFDIASGHWSLLDTHLSMPRTTAAVAATEGGRIFVVGGAPSLSSAEIYAVPEPEPRGAPSPPAAIGSIPEGRMGCQAVAMQLPAQGASYPICSRTCVVVVGGENGEEDWEGMQAQVRQFSTAVVYDEKDSAWRPESYLPAMSVARTAMALCVGHGRIRGYPPLPRAGVRGGS